MYHFNKINNQTSGDTNTLYFIDNSVVNNFISFNDRYFNIYSSDINNNIDSNSGITNTVLINTSFGFGTLRVDGTSQHQKNTNGKKLI